MAIRNIDAFKSAMTANDKMVATTIATKKAMLLSLLEEIKPYVADLKDMRDTYKEVERLNADYAKRLWHYLTGHCKMDFNSYFGVMAEGTGFYMSITVTTVGLVIYYDPNTREALMDWRSQSYKGDNAEEYIKANTFSEVILDQYIKSVQLFMANFPSYAEKFFDMVEHPNF